MEKWLIVDGSNLLFQMFYGMPARILGPSGRPIQGTLGFVGALLKMIRMVKPTHVAALFDGESHNPRKDLDEAYKANRPDYSLMPQEEVPFSQLPDIYAALSYMGIAHAETVDCEADDWMAGYARRCGEARELVIASFDSDLFQLIGPKVHILRYRGDHTVICDECYLQQKLGIPPKLYAAHKALTGDHSDNICGVKGIGPKTATALLQRFGSLDALLEGCAAIERPAIRRAVEENRQRIRLNETLIALEGAAALPFTPAQMVWEDRAYTTGQVLRAIGLR